MLVCAIGLAGCDPGADSTDSAEDEAAEGAQALVLPPTLPPAPAGATCVLLQRGASDVADSDLSQGNGHWAAGGYPFLWTGQSPYDHWSLFRFDLSPIPQGAQIVLAAFSVFVSSADTSATVRAHRIVVPWSEATVSWPNFGGAASWDPAVAGSFDPAGLGFKSIDVTGLAQTWASGLQPNHGLLLEEDPVKLHMYFASEVSNAERRPSLYVCYQAGGPCGGKHDGDACDDGNACTLGESCLNGQCLGGSPKVCDPLDACHDAGICDPATGVCSDPERPDGAACDDGDPCTAPDTCASGACTGSAVSCDDGDACTADACDPAAGCVHTAASCDDGAACTVDSCAAGACQHVVKCAAGEPCSQGFCASPAGQDPQFAWLCQ